MYYVCVLVTVLSVSRVMISLSFRAACMCSAYDCVLRFLSHRDKNKRNNTRRKIPHTQHQQHNNCAKAPLSSKNTKWRKATFCLIIQWLFFDSCVSLRIQREFFKMSTGWGGGFVFYSSQEKFLAGISPPVSFFFLWIKTCAKFLELVLPWQLISSSLAPPHFGKMICVRVREIYVTCVDVIDRSFVFCGWRL